MKNACTPGSTCPTTSSTWHDAALTGELPPRFQIFNGWVMISHQEIYVVERTTADAQVCGHDVPAYGKTDYFNDVLPRVMKGGA